MAKQTFSVGQVLTAAQMTSLQQTAMLGGSATAKTTSYTLVAADAGTVVSVNSTSATTITVNTGIFSAGDIVTIQNWGSGSTTITAGTATVNTAGSLIVPQYDGGVLYFTSASAAIYFDFVQAGAVSPLTTKGDIWVYGSSDTRLAVGSNDQVLTADSSTATGLKWAAPASSGGMTLLSTTALSGSSVTVSSISSSYTDLYVEMRDCRTSSDDRTVQIRFNSDSGSNYPYVMIHMNVGTLSGSAGTGTALWFSKTNSSSTTTTLANASMRIPTYKSTSYTKAYSMGYNSINPSGSQSGVGYGKWSSTSAINEITIFPDSGTFSAGTLLIYGVS